MQPMEEAQLKTLAAGMQALDRLVRPDRPDLAPGYFTVVRAGWLRIGVGSAAARKALIRLQGPSADPDDDVLLEAKEVANLGGLACLEESTTPQAPRVVAGAWQIGRLKTDILASGPTLLNPTLTGHAETWLDWWVASWEPSYREVDLADLRAVGELAEIAFDSGVQLGASKVAAVRTQTLSSVAALEARLRRETLVIVEDLLTGWRELAAP